MNSGKRLHASVLVCTAMYPHLEPNPCLDKRLVILVDQAQGLQQPGELCLGMHCQNVGSRGGRFQCGWCQVQTALPRAAYPRREASAKVCNKPRTDILQENIPRQPLGASSPVLLVCSSLFEAMPKVSCNTRAMRFVNSELCRSPAASLQEKLKGAPDSPSLSWSRTNRCKEGATHAGKVWSGCFDFRQEILTHRGRNWPCHFYSAKQKKSRSFYSLSQ